MEDGARGARTIDDLWRELNARAAPPPRPVVRNAATSGIAGLGLPGVTTHTRILPSKSGAGGKAGSSGGGGGWGAGGAAQPAQPPAPPPVPLPPEAAGVSAADLQSYVVGLQRTINCLTDPDRSTRRRAIESLSAKLLRGDAATPAAGPQLLQAVLCGPLLAPLTAMLSDTVERCRCCALQLLLDSAGVVPDLQPLLPPLLPPLAARVAAHPPAEPAEELRLQAAQLVGRFVERVSGSALLPHVRELAALLAAGLEDPYHEIKKAAAGVLAALAVRVPPAALEPHAERLLSVLVAGLGHAHSRVRQALLAALDALLAAGAAPHALVERIVVPGVRPLAADRATAVREAFFAALGRWMGAGAGSQADGGQAGGSGWEGGPEGEGAAARCRRLAPLLLPLLLLGVSDEAEPVAALVLSTLENVGDAWAAAGPAEAAEAAAAAAAVDGAAGGTAAADAPAAAMEVDGADGGAQQQLEPSAAAVEAAGLQPPYRRLPRAGARAMGAALLPALLPPLLRELGEWTIAQRCAAARCLHALLVLAGGAATPQLARLVPALCSAVGDDDADVAGRVAACVRVVGALVPAAHWLPLAADAVADGKAGAGARANALVVLSRLAHAAGRAGQRLAPQQLAALAAALGGDEALGAAAEHAGARAQLLVAVRAVLEWAGAAAGEPAVAGPLYRALLQLHGSAEADGPAAAGEAAAVRETLAQLEAVAARAAANSGGESAGGGGGVLCAALGPPLLESLTADARSWAPGSPALLAFGSLLRTAPPRCLAALLPRAFDAVAPIVADADADPGVRLALLALLEDLLRDDASAEAFRAPGAAAAALTRLLMPPLTWRAGKVAAAVRFASVRALAAAVERRVADEGALRAAVDAGLLPLLHQCLDEDWHPEVRLAAAAVEASLLAAVGRSLSDEQRRAVYTELLKRLDDSSNAVRVAACGAIAAFAGALPAHYCDANSGYLAAGVVPHMDDGDAAVSAAAAAALEALAAVKPAAVAAEVSKARPVFRAVHLCDRVLAACGAGGGSGGGGDA
ncbi:hypothetical protein Rsub_02112 [Raphidocelis subcapitata]|uniref:TOG domain-containing protein n=1 Tax=Raphidocelis subcapitata TaxID=307507 RepID=A0A2V0NWP4_9CHLO|nr:hypothetical protein Rsub_02112 [Raphidocelis subcapitata]|eukprot:GBF89235.1 hypothetical protein Rsub_02112 [Raphidocelis subcapitata]